MDPVLSSLFPINQIGSDGFNWWVGQVESNKNDDPKNSGRYRVRIVGQHLKDCDATPTNELPWANVMMPVTTPFTDGGTTGASVDLRQGNWVIGFYLDADKQKPIIMGSIGHTAGSTLIENYEKDPNPSGTCKSFTTYFDPERNPYKHEPLPEKKKDGGEAEADDSKYTKPGQTGLIAAAVPGKAPASFYALFAENTATNPTGAKVCVEIANPKCGSESDLSGGLTNILSEMLAANQQSGGQLGDYYVSQINGELSNYESIARTYVNKATRLVSSFVSRAKGEVVNVVREGIDGLVEVTLIADVPTTDELGNVNTGPVAPDLGVEPFQPITKKESRLKPVLDVINEILDDLGCEMADFTDTLAQWLTDLLLDIFMEAFNAVTCLIDAVVESIINEILNGLEEILSTVLGPLQDFLDTLADPLNVIGSAINEVFSLLGISCDGPSTQCEKVTKECTDCGTEDTEDWLDKLIEQLEDGPLAGSSICDESKESTEDEETSIVFVGGIFEPAEDVPVDSDVASLENIFVYRSSDVQVVEGKNATFTIFREGNTLVSSSVKYQVINGSATEGIDFIKPTNGGTLGFAPGESEKTLVFKTLADDIDENVETFQIKLSEGTTPEGSVVSFPDGKIFVCEILNYDLNAIKDPISELPTGIGEITSTQSTTILNPPANFITSPVKTKTTLNTILPTLPTYTVIPNRNSFFEGEEITFNIVTQNVSDNVTLSYTISGDISSNDVDGGQLTGSFTVVNNFAEVKIKTTINNDFSTQVEDEDGNLIDEDIPDPSERLIFSIDNTNASAIVTILGDDIPEDPYYFVESDKIVYDEGETITYTITSVNVPDNTVVNYELSGPEIEKTDIIEYELSGTFTIVNNAATVLVQIAKDADIENSELLTFSIVGVENGDATSVIISADPIPEDEEVTIITPSFFVESDKIEYMEGETAEFTVTTSNVPDGTNLQYVLYGSSLKSNDIINGKLFGTFVIYNNTAKIYVGINKDLEIETNETITFIINGTGASAQIIVLGDIIEDEPVIITPLVPCINPPTAGVPVTNDSGAIISIPISRRGCPYQKPPRVIVRGKGYGASAIALLDENGYVSEIRVTRTGRGYVKNNPDNQNLTCVIDSYTLLNPGRGYTSEPDVFINGEQGIARARINELGYVFSVEVLDRTKTFKNIPSIIIRGGGGAGARVLPSLNCLDKVELETRGYTKIGTGKYIDCP
jgi:hypothetical protein